MINMRNLKRQLPSSSDEESSSEDVPIAKAKPVPVQAKKSLF